MQFVANLHEQDIIRTVRVSPLDAQRGCSAGKFADKVTGETLAHFGAFLKRSWRSNDILYGRLDGACQLIETLLCSTRSWVEETLGDRLARRWPPCKLDPDGGEPRAPGIAQWLTRREMSPGPPPPR